MADMLSQEEIDALLSGASTELESDKYELSSQEKDALGEIGNISMGTSATTLFNLLNQKVTITTPVVTVTTWDDLSKDYHEQLVGVRVLYTVGLEGYNMLVIKEKDVKVITDLMMGGEGIVTDEELSELHFSAISEAMNQMVGSAATSMSSLFNKRIDISPPQSFKLNFDNEEPPDDFKNQDQIIKIAFKMEVGDLIDSEIMQLLPIDFAKDIVKNLLDSGNDAEIVDVQPTSVAAVKTGSKSSYDANDTSKNDLNQELLMEDDYGMEEEEEVVAPRNKRNVNVKPAKFQSFDEGKILLEKKNISMIMDVPLQVTVELGRTNKMIRDILEFGSGSIIELDKLAGEPVDILVNGKIIAKGEVVVIDESFGVRITDIIKPSKRL